MLFSKQTTWTRWEATGSGFVFKLPFEIEVRKTVAMLVDIPEELFSFQRASKRYPCCLEGVFTSEDNTVHTIKCSDISLHGVGGITSLRLPLNTCVKIKAMCRHSRTLLLQGRVCWCKKDLNGYRVGIELYKPLPFVLTSIVQ
jgi:hypothetical protein